MKDEILRYYVPKTFIRKEMRYNFFLGLTLGIVSTLIIGLIVWLIFIFIGLD